MQDVAGREEHAPTEQKRLKRGELGHALDYHELVQVGPAQPGDGNYAMFDVWTLGHAAFGAGLRYIGATPLEAVSLAVLWEIAEPTLKRSYPKAFPEAQIDSPANKAGDVIGWMAGYGVVYVLKP